MLTYKFLKIAIKWEYIFMGIVKLDLNFHGKVMKNNQKISGKMDSQEDSAQLDSKILYKNSLKDFILKNA